MSGIALEDVKDVEFSLNKPLNEVMGSSELKQTQKIKSFFLSSHYKS